ncbi:MAG: LytTR family DNA-binding domain-containing protein [Verrucomicrobiota bacterium]
MKLTAIIVDDEPLGRERVRTLLGEEPDIEILAEFASAAAALAAMRERLPDVLFLDVQMPEIDGFELLRRLGSPLPLVIFVTAFDEHAVAAFEVHALDYLLKPIKPARLAEALQRARAQLAEQNGEGRARRLLALLESRKSDTPYLSRLAVRDRDRTRFVKVSDVDWIEASGNYIVIHAGTEKYIVRETLAAIEVQLSPQEFFRLNRSALVRLDRVREIEPMFNEDHVVILTNNLRLPLTRSVRELQERLRYA